MFSSFTEAKEVLLPRSKYGEIKVNGKELEDYEALFPPQNRNAPAVFTLDGHKLILKV